MARIVLACWGSQGDLFPYIGLASALKARGHEPVVASFAHYRPHVERAGVAFHPVRPDVDPTEPGTVARVLDPWRGPEYLVRELLMPAMEVALEDTRAAAEGADLVVSHPLTFAAPMAAGLRGIPWLGTVLSPMSIFSAYDLPTLPLAPRLSEAARSLGPGFARLLLKVARAATRPWTRELEAMRARLGLPAIGHPLFDGGFSPWGTLALFPRLMATPQPDWPPGTELTGFVPYNPGVALDPEVASFLDAGEPPIVFTLGSSAVHAHRAFYAQSAEAARRLGRRALLLAGPHAPLGGDGRNLLSVPYAPHEAVFPRASALVVSGGIGTVGQALRSGKPMLVVPFAYDQSDNARRVHRLGVSRVCPIKRYAAPRAARDLNALLASSSYKEAAAVAGRETRAEGGTEAACDRIGHLLLHPGRSTT